ncbi:MAG: DUF2007 domain-containing protein [Gloeobacteraceae cyanobacterium ES-bin-316]|nr:DUF2007 domain-containing protein [Ferruginibacter sp.]
METVIIRTFHNSIPAQITFGKLQEAGIESYIFGEAAVTMSAFANSPSGGIQLVVKKDDEQQARQLLYEFDEAYLKSVVCSMCGSNNIILLAKDTPGNMLTGLLKKLFSVNPAAEQIYKCGNCGNETDSLPEPPEDYYSKDLL